MKHFWTKAELQNVANGMNIGTTEQETRKELIGILRQELGQDFEHLERLT